jgi:DNA repair protein RadC
MAYKSIKEWPENERPRERLISHGPAGMSEAQLIAIILRTGGGGRSAIDLAMELLDKFGGLRKIEQASISELCASKGLGKAKAAQIKSALELGKRMFNETAFKGPMLSNSSSVFSYFHPKFRDLKKEIFYCAMLDVKNRLINESKISEGSLTTSVVHPREEFKNAVNGGVWWGHGGVTH